MTDCIYHPGVKAIGNCANCGKPFCRVDVTETAEGKFYCRICSSQICMAPRPGPGPLAITSLVLSLAGFMFCLLTSIPGMVLGYVELANIRKGESSREGRGFALAGAIVGTAVTAVIGLVVILTIIFFITGLWRTA